jgi:aspartate/methionine/tyrosine aminotransferase
MWARGEQVFHLAFGESRFPVHPRLTQALGRHAGARSYVPSLGIPELRQAIATQQSEILGQDVDPERVVVGPGSKSLLFATLLALGEEVMLTRPSWVTYAPQVHLLGKTLTWVPTTAEDRYTVNLDVLSDVIRDARTGWGNPEVLVVNSPNNPTGTMARPDQVAGLAEFARENGIMLVSDEIYSLTAHGTIPHASPGEHFPEGTVVIGGLSKSLSLGGWRVGHAVLPAGEGGPALARAIGGIASNVWSCVAAPVQHAVVESYGMKGEVAEYRELCTAMHAARTRALYAAVIQAGIECVAPDGGFYVYPSFGRWAEALAAMGIRDDRMLATHLLDRYGIAALPGSAFHGDDPFSLRLSSSFVDAETDEKAEALVEAFSNDPDPVSFIRDHHPGMAEVGRRLAEFTSLLENR